MATTPTSSDNFRNDSQVRSDGALINAISGLGTSKSKITHTQVGTKSLLSQTELESLYTHGIVRRIVDSVGNECTKNRTTVELGDETEVETIDWVPQFDEFLKETQFHQRLSEVVKLQRLYGGAGLVMLIDDGRLPEEEVDWANIRSINDYVPLSRYELIPEDFTITDYSRPNHYRITTSQRLTESQEASYVNLRVHHTRVARFDGLYLPWNLRSQNTGWGQPVVGSIWEALKRYLTALDGLIELTQGADMYTHKIPGLFQRIASGNEGDLRKRLEANNLARSVYGGMVLDTEEEVEFLNRNITGIAGALEPFIRDLQAALGWPASILMGDSPGGLGKEGRFEERAWAAIVESWQENYMRTAVTEVFKIILLQKEGPTRGQEPKNWAVYFPSCFVETDKEKAELRFQMAQVDAQYLQLGVLNPIEIRESRFGESTYSIETTLNESVSNQLEASSDAQFEAQMLGYHSQAEAYLTPPDLDTEPGKPQGEGIIQQAQPRSATATDSFEKYDAHGIAIQVTHKDGDIRVGYPVGPDNQRVDSSDSAPQLVLGPNRTRAYKLYRARFDLHRDGELTEGPYVAGFASMRAAKRAVITMFPHQNVVGLTPVPEGEIESLRAGWGAY